MKKNFLLGAGLVLIGALTLGVGAGLFDTAKAIDGKATDDTNEETIDFSAKGYLNGQAMTSVVDGNFNVTFNKGTNTNNAPKYYTSGTAVRVYGGNSFTVSSNLTINEITITFGSDEGSNEITSDTGSYFSGTWTGSATSVTFTVGGTSGHRRIQTITAVMSSSSEGTETPDPTDTAITNVTISGDEILTFEPDAGNETVLTATIDASYTTDIVKWTSSNEEVASVEANQNNSLEATILTTGAEGEAIITAQAYASDGTTIREGACDSITVKVQGSVENPNLVEKVEDIIDGGIYYITHKRDGIRYYLNNKNGAIGAPSAMDTPDSTAKFKVDKLDNGEFVFYVAEDNSEWLYCNDSNNGVRIGTNANNQFLINESQNENELSGNFILQHKGTNRYLTLYEKQDFRCYTSATASNRLENTDLILVEKPVGIETLGDTLTLGASSVAIGETITATIPYTADTELFSETVETLTAKITNEAEREFADLSVKSIENGIVTLEFTGKSVGTITKVSLSSTFGATGEYAINLEVNNGVVPTSITISKDVENVYEYEPVIFKASCLNASGTTAGVNPDVEWVLTDGSSTYAELDQNGILTPIKDTPANITVGVYAKSTANDTITSNILEFAVINSELSLSWTDINLTYYENDSFTITGTFGYKYNSGELTVIEPNDPNITIHLLDGADDENPTEITAGYILKLEDHGKLVRLTYTDAYGNSAKTTLQSCDLVVLERPLFDLKLASYNSDKCSKESVTWESLNLNLELVKLIDDSTAANNYLGGANDHTRFYKNQKLTFMPKEGYIIDEIKILFVTGRFKGANDNGLWNNATISMDEETLLMTVTPDNGMENVILQPNDTIGATAIYATVRAITNVDYVNQFVKDNMHFSDVDISNTADTGSCRGDTGYYAAAKEALLALSDEQIALFQSDDAFNDAQERYEAWARANGDLANMYTKGTGLPQRANPLLASNNLANTDYMPIVLIVIGGSLILASTYFFFKKKKED